MSSTITNYSQNINAAYPVPGVDNDTQGFRDNFSNIKNALSVASKEITDLQLEVNGFTLPQSLSLDNVFANYIESDVVKSTTLNAGNVIASGNVSADRFIGDGSGLTGIAFSNTLTSLNVSGNGSIGGSLTVIGTLTCYSISTQSVGVISTASGINNTIIGIGGAEAGYFTNISSDSLNVRDYLNADFITAKTLKINSNDNLAIDVTGGGRFSSDFTVNGDLFVTKIYENGHQVLTTASTNIAEISAGLSALSGIVQSSKVLYKDHGELSPVSSLSVDYRQGNFQKYILSAFSVTNALTSFKVTNWPAAGNFARMQVEFSWKDVPVYRSWQISSDKLTTYGVASTIVDFWEDQQEIGPIRPGWGLYPSSGSFVSGNKLAEVTAIIDPYRFSIDRGLTLSTSTSYRFYPPFGSGNYFEIELVNDSGQTVYCRDNLSAKSTQPPNNNKPAVTIEDYNSNKAVFTLYSYDGGSTIYVEDIAIYKF